MENEVKIEVKEVPNVGVYVIYDKVSELSGPMFEAINDAIAMRQAVNVLYPLPSSLRDDYDLVKIADYNPRTMQLELICPTVIDITLSMARRLEGKS